MSLNGTYTNTADGSNVDISLITPVGTPGVSNNIVFLSVLGSISYSDDGVIGLVTTLGGVENTTLVTLEVGSLGINGDRGWSLSDSSLQGRN